MTLRLWICAGGVVARTVFFRICIAAKLAGPFVQTIVVFLVIGFMVWWAAVLLFFVLSQGCLTSTHSDLCENLIRQENIRVTKSETCHALSFWTAPSQLCDRIG